MANKWPNNGSDIGGILKRKNPIIVPQNNEKNLLIFGYGCKIFRDDEKAKHIDQGKHLIPWMGNNNHKIDRYDVRTTLSDLSQYEPPAGGYDNRLDYLTSEEKRAEELCEEERYYSLKHNEEDELMYQEEELKRLHQERSSCYGQVKFDYNAQLETNQPTNDDDDSKSDEPDELYVKPNNFEIPVSIALPDTMKQHAIIEKTAKFISTQGPQMEILIKAKQSNNPQFEFLNQNNILNPYYKFVLSALKNGTYPKEEKIEQQQKENDDKLQLANKQQNGFELNNPLSLFNSNFINTPRIPIPTIQYKPSANCSYTQLISKIKGVPLPVLTNSDTSNDNKILNGNQQNQNVIENNIPNESIENNKKIDGVEIKKISSGLALAQCYSSDSESENDNDEIIDNNNKLEIIKTEPIINFPIPPESERNVIDKTAAYVAKNGKQFEETLKLKGDLRFSFLNDYHEFNQYYVYKVNDFIPADSKMKTINPVSFSIKTKDDSSMSIKPGLPQETSDDESDNKIENNLQSINTQNNNNNNNLTIPNQTPIPISKLPEHVQKAIQLVENQLVAKSKTVAASGHPLMGIMGNSLRSRFDIDCAGNPINRQMINVPINNQMLLENQKELKRAEEKVKDRLAQIAREKLGLISKEKQLQLERKKKAMAFLNQIKSTTEQNDNKSNEKIIKENDSDKESVHSIPISSYGGDDNKDNDNDNNKSPYEYHNNRRPSPFLTDKQQDIDETIELPINRSRSKSQSSKRKKSKHRNHSRKKSKKSSRSRSRSTSYSQVSQNSHKKHSVSRKAKKKKREHDD